MNTGTEHRHPSGHGVVGPAGETAVEVTVDGQRLRSEIDSRTTLLDLLRERLDVTAPKKGCDHGQCGSCTVLLDGRRHLTCLALAVAHDGAEIVTASGLGHEGGGTVRGVLP